MAQTVGVVAEEQETELAGQGWQNLTGEVEKKNPDGQVHAPLLFGVAETTQEVQTEEEVQMLHPDPHAVQTPFKLKNPDRQTHCC